MPRLTVASRRARRDAIADAALQVFDRRGVAHASTADIIEEMGGSPGGMYSHFSSKAELVRFIAERVLGTGFDAIILPDGRVSSPVEILRVALSEMAATTPTRLIVQLWGEATVDKEMHVIVQSTLQQVEDSLRQAVLPWARTLPGDAEVRATRTAKAMRAITQGYIVQLALFGAPDPERYFDDLSDLLDFGA